MQLFRVGWERSQTDVKRWVYRWREKERERERYKEERERERERWGEG